MLCADGMVNCENCCAWGWLSPGNLVWGVDVAEAETSFGPGGTRDTEDLRVSTTGGCWSTGKKLHSFFKRMQLTQRPWTSDGDNRHRIFLRRQWPSKKKVRQIPPPYCQAPRCCASEGKATYHKPPRYDGIQVCSDACHPPGPAEVALVSVLVVVEDVLSAASRLG